MKRAFLMVAFFVSAAVPLTASSDRTFVSSSGLDTDPCSRTSPCRSFTVALAQTLLPGGTIVALDSAGYGPVTIGQSVSLIAPEGIYAAISVPVGGRGISISGTASTDVVYVRGLSIEGPGGQQLNYGVFVGDAISEVHIERCVFRRLIYGIDFVPSTSGSLDMSDTTITNTTWALFGTATVGTNLHVSIDHCRLIHNFDGVLIASTIAGAMTNSVSTGNNYGAYFDGAVFTVDHCQITNNVVGLYSYNGANVYVSNSTIFDNGTGLQAVLGGLLWSRVSGEAGAPVKTNTLINNGTDGSFTGIFGAQ